MHIIYSFQKIRLTLPSTDNFKSRKIVLDALKHEFYLNHTQSP